MEKKYTQKDVDLVYAVLAYTDDEFADLQKNFPLTQELWEHCLELCIIHGKPEKYNELWNSYPEFADRMMKNFDEVAAKSTIQISDEETEAKFAEFKSKMREKYGEDFI